MTDPRPLFRDAHAWFTTLISGDLGAPTPCADWDVRTVIAHVIASVDRARVVVDGGSPWDVPVFYDDIADADLAARHQEAVRRTLASWVEPSVLDRLVTAPWGTVPARAAVAGWVKEPLVHGWDIAVALGLPSEGPAAAAEFALADAARFLPADARDERTPFAAVVEVDPQASPTERLAGWLGHARR